MSVILMVLFLILQMTLYLTDTTRMTALTAEDVTFCVAEEEVRRQWRSESGGGFFYLQESAIIRFADAKKVEVEYPSTAISLGYGIRPEIHLKQTRKVRDPVHYLWRIRMIRDKIG